MGLINLFKSSRSKKKEKADHVQMEYSQITPSLYVGTNACCTVHYKLKFIDKGIMHDVSLEGERIDAPFGVETFLWLPTEDHKAPNQNALHLGVSYLNKIFARKGKAYVHCKNGHGRGPTLVAAWFVSQGMTTDEAIAAVTQKRKETHIESVQVSALRKFEKSFKKKM